MAKYLILWQIDTTRVPGTPQELRAMYEGSLAMVEQDAKTGISKDWGQFVGEPRGYGIAEGTEVEIAKMLQKYVPYLQFELHPVMPARLVRQVIKAMPR
jgi:hypothetical protein